MRTWVWPLSWWCRIRQLEAELKYAQAVNTELRQKLDTQMRVHALEQVNTFALYSSTLASMLSNIENGGFLSKFRSNPPGPGQDIDDTPFG